MSLLDEIALHRTRLERMMGQRALIEDQLSGLNQSIKDSAASLKNHEEALEVIKQVGLKTQEKLQYHISDIATLALSAVFPEPYELSVDFVLRRNKIECDISFLRNGEKINPLTESGGGAVDVASFALRIASWSMKHPRTRPTIVLDEPMKNVSRNLQEKASQMIKEVSEKLGIQFIIVTHEPTLTEYADRIFETKFKKGKTTIHQIK